MEIYLVYRYFDEMNDSCVVAAFVKEGDALAFKKMRSKMIENSEPHDYFYIVPQHLVK